MWFDAYGLEERIQVSRCGRVRTKSRYVKNHPSGVRLIKGRELKCSINKSGYKTVDLRRSTLKECKMKVFYLHRIIAETFIDNPSNLPVVNHIDGNKTNNSTANLEWCTKKHNHQHAWKSGLCENQKKPVIKYLDGFGVWYPSMRSPKGCNPSLIHAAINGRQKTHRGFFWDYC